MTPQGLGLLLSGLAVVLGAVTLFVVVRQLHVMRRQLQVMGEQQTTMRQQTESMQRQLRIVEDQHEILRRQIAKRVDPTVLVSVRRLDGGSKVRLEFLVQNNGDKSMANFYWHLYAPQALSGDGNFRAPEDIVVEGTAVRHYTSVVRDPVYPTRQVLLGYVDLQSPYTTGNFEVRWMIITEDGAFPPNEGRLNRTLVSL